MKKPLGYLAGDIMSKGAELQRKEEYEAFLKLNLPVDVYSPIMNKSINDKSSMTVEENNKLAEKIVAADIDRLWNSDFVVLEPLQHAIGTMCEVGTLYGWKYLCDKLLELEPEEIKKELEKISKKNIFCHYYDLRTNHLPEIDFRRSFGINQMLYGMVLYIAKNGDFESFDKILEDLSKLYKEQNHE